MLGLLDYIFSSVEVESLDKKKVMEYLCYIQEITPQVHTVEELVKLAHYRVRLTKRLIYLDGIALQDLSSKLAEDRPAINSKKRKI